MVIIVIIIVIIIIIALLHHLLRSGGVGQLGRGRSLYGPPDAAIEFSGVHRSEHGEPGVRMRSPNCR